MKGAAVSDLHLGFRAFAATAGGRNQREIDVERAWSAAVDRIIEADPELATVAGDVVHHPRVGTHGVKAWRDGVRRIVEETEATVIAIQGNHDAGRTAEVLTPLVLPDDYARVYIVTEPRRIRVNGLHETIAVACLPFVALGEDVTYRLDPDPDADVNVLVIHAPVNTSAEGAERLPVFYAGDTSLDVDRLAERFDVIAAGDYHEFHRLHPEHLAFYSGSIERTSSNIWPEDPRKGVVLYDTDTGEMELREVPTRHVVDRTFAEVHGGTPTADALNEVLESWTGVWPDAIARLVVDDFPREDRGDVDWSLVRELKRECLHFQLDLRFRARGEVAVRDRREREARTLLDDARDFFADDEEPVRDRALAYLGGGS